MSNSLPPLPTSDTVYVFCLTHPGTVWPVAYFDPVTLTFEPTPILPDVLLPPEVAPPVVEVGIWIVCPTLIMFGFEIPLYFANA